MAWRRKGQGLIVIADDITGAAEIAGIAHSRGLTAEMLVVSGEGDLAAAESDQSEAESGQTEAESGQTEAESGQTTDAGGRPQVLVVATNTRSMAIADSTALTTAIGRWIMACSPGGERPAVFKKTDSALRGHVVEELAALTGVLGHERALFLPANPSKKRIISSGIYYINNVEISDTDFRFDPEFPATSAVMSSRFPTAGAHHIDMPDTTSEDDIRRLVSQTDPATTLLAGAADLFSAFIDSFFGLEKWQVAVQEKPTGSFSALKDGFVFICGSTQSVPPELGIAQSPMPLALYDGGNDVESWPIADYNESHSLMLTIPHRHLTGPAIARHLTALTARMTARLIAIHCPAQLIIEGGATAFAVLSHLGWHSFQICRQLAPGVVQMRSERGTLVTMKPGSYPWGQAIEKMGVKPAI